MISRGTTQRIGPSQDSGEWLPMGEEDLKTGESARSGSGS